MGSQMCLESIEFTIAFVAIPVSAFVRSILQVNVRVTPEVGFTNESLVALRTLKRLIVCLHKS